MCIICVRGVYRFPIALKSLELRPASIQAILLQLIVHGRSGCEHYLASKSRDFLVEKGIFNAHTVYTLGAATVVPEEGRLTVALSSENLLLNAYRQTRFGFPSYLCVDTTHRLIKVLMCLLPTNCFSKVLCVCAFTHCAGRPQQHVGGNGRLEPAVPHRGVCHLLSRRRARARGGVLASPCCCQRSRGAACR